MVDEDDDDLCVGLFGIEELDCLELGESGNNNIRQVLWLLLDCGGWIMHFSPVSNVSGLHSMRRGRHAVLQTAP